jgi:hypothetical protein
MSFPCFRRTIVTSFVVDQFSKKQKQSKAKNPTKQSINQFRRRWTKVREVEGKGKGKEKQDIQ